MIQRTLQQNNGIIISALASDCGKTTTTAMLLAALTQRNIKIQPYKVGADIFDPGMHCKYSKEISLNLDTWIMNTDNIINIVKKMPIGYRGIVEGWEGIFDHNSPDSKQSTTMEIAHLLNWPIVLVLCCEQEDNIDIEEIDLYIEKAGKFAGNNRIAGIILNKVSNLEFAEKFIQNLKNKGIKTFGCINKSQELEHPIDVHNASVECDYHCPSPEKLATIAEQYLDIESILALTTSIKENNTPLQIYKKAQKKNNKKRIAISHDNAFFFYYKDNSEFLAQHNVEIIEFSPLQDKQLPENIDGLILSGGIPENYAQQLTNNFKLRKDIKNKIEAGLLCYAECGGLMYLCQGIYLHNRDFFPMIGCVPGIVELTKKLQNFGYTICQTQVNKELLSIRGHEYHYASWLEEKKLANLWQSTNCQSKLSRIEGYKTENIHASFVHLYFPTAEALICDFFHLD